MAVTPSPSPDLATAESRWRHLLATIPVHELVANARVDREGLNMRPRPDNATWVCSLWDHFGRYPLDEFRLLPRALRLPCATAFVLIRTAFPRRVLQGAWLLDNPPLATPLRPGIDTAAAPIPEPGTARRGMLEPPPPGTECIGLPSRIVWLRPHGTPPTSNDRADAGLEARAGGIWRPLAEGDFAAAARLYDLLYREKYSPLNPAYTPTFLRETQRCGLLQLEGLFDDGRLMGVIGLHRIGNWMTTPVLGYDPSTPRQLGLYRRLTARITFRAAEVGCHLHRSAGAGSFKRLRGARPQLEWIWLGAESASVGLRLLRVLARASLQIGLRRGM